jgi:hypothetical protein
MTVNFKLVRLYPNGDRNRDRPSLEELPVQVAYNLEMRPGCAMFLDGLCIYKGIKGSISNEQIEAFSRKLLSEMEKSRDR